jgi:hypothetical protein
MLFHVLNRGVGRMHLFLKDADFEAFERVTRENARHPAHADLRVLTHVESLAFRLVARARLGPGQTDAELEAIRKSVIRGQPYGRAEWVDRAARRLGLESTLRSRGQPKRARREEIPPCKLDPSRLSAPRPFSPNVHRLAMAGQRSHDPDDERQRVQQHQQEDGRQTVDANRHHVPSAAERWQ